MITYLDFLNEEEDTDKNFKRQIIRALRNFLAGENIRGFSSDISSIILGDPSKEVIIDVIDLYQKDGIVIEKKDIIGMDPSDLLNKYLEKNKMSEYLNSILYISGEVKKENHSGDDPEKKEDLYYLDPSESDKIVWAWDNEKLDGTPRILLADNLEKLKD